MPVLEHDFAPMIALGRRGLVFGADTRLAPTGSDGDLNLDPERLTELLSAAFRRMPSSKDLAAIDSAASYWRHGDKALANLRLVFADLPRLDAPEDVIRLKAAEMLFDAGLRAEHLQTLFDSSASADDLGKGYNPAQPRVAAGSGPTSGQWTKLWERFSAWLAEEVPEYDHDTGTQVGTRSRARAIAINPLTWIAGFGAVLGGAEIVAATPAVGSLAVDPPAVLPAIEEAEALTPFAQRYLATSGGRLGSTQTRQQLYQIAREHDLTGNYTELTGDGYGPEEFIRDPLTGKGTYVDLTLKHLNGETIRIQTIDTLANGLSPTAREALAASRIQRLRPMDKLHLVPKQ